ncbi:MAG TPA: hypothetical protein VGO40_23615 [Longimicrobium sp.]|jgi:hypothetical protein|nr:hypothetical protein [Longimicrobium sp.]
MDAALAPSFASFLRAARPELNARFAEARRQRPDLDGEAFARFLREAADPLVRAVERVQPERAPEVARAAYELGLELVGQRLAGPAARDPWVNAGWREVAPAAAALVAAAPERVLGALGNALHRLAATPGARPAEWVTAMAALAPRCADGDAFLAAGQVAAWRAGMAHYRAGALAAADALPPELALAAVRAPGGGWPEVRRRLAADPWFDPSAPAAAGLRVVARAGAFRGFGGLFAQPPVAVAAGEHFLVRSGGDCWLLTADAFGATFHRATAEESKGPHPSSVPPGVTARGTTVSVDGAHLDLPELGEITGVAANGTTLALTSPLSHAVVLLALA